ncbi:hypothetical protein [Pseudomonas shahriarae]|uniref:hypothetical protein n=1 Tax=Pseudomonas shahriarae TaxID=2745512 RepID=UPI002360B358|nr:hypothetical protein [Pseudomonas shahriarae]MDD0981114.1 hypothetical protein [Pseudomonas shahriarae]
MQSIQRLNQSKGAAFRVCSLILAELIMPACVSIQAQDSDLNNDGKWGYNKVAPERDLGNAANEATTKAAQIVISINEGSWDQDHGDTDRYQDKDGQWNE